MNEAIHISSRQFQYIARISHGKDSMKMLDVIVSRGLPLDRITTTDIWATDTIRGEHPKMVEFKDMRYRCNCPEYEERPCDNPNEELECEECQHGKPEESEEQK